MSSLTIAIPQDGPFVQMMIVSTQGFMALIGRDVLAHGLFLYHGQAGMMSLAF